VRSIVIATRARVGGGRGRDGRGVLGVGLDVDGLDGLVLLRVVGRPEGALAELVEDDARVDEGAEEEEAVKKSTKLSVKTIPTFSNPE